MTAVAAPSDLSADRERARAAERAALAQYRALRDRLEHVRRKHRDVGADGTVRQLVEHEAELLVRELDAQLGEAAHRLSDANRARREAEVAHANSRLREMLPSHRKAAVRAEEALAKLDAAALRLIVAAWTAADALAEERFEANRMTVAAAEALPDDARRALRVEGRHRVPTRIDADGATGWMERPDPAHDFLVNPLEPASLDGVSKAASVGWQRRGWLPTQLQRRLEKELSKGEPLWEARRQETSESR
jgi:hypothetical protein